MSSRVVVRVAFLVCLAPALGCQQDGSETPPKTKPVQVEYETDKAVAVPEATEGRYSRPFYENATYKASVTRPQDLLGHPIGERAAEPARIVKAFRTWANESPRAQLERYALSHEGRELVRVVITSEQNHKRLKTIQADLGRLANPAGLPSAELERIVRDTPPVAWFGYSIHGDEVSGCDAALAFGYHLIAADNPEVAALLDAAVVVIDPVMNPDGRQRILNHLRESASRVGNENHRSMHRGHWPYGRGNHYLFDMNRDWIYGVAPETRGRWKALLAFRPQLLVDAHEMGAQDTYLFYPKSEPVNLHFAPSLKKWYRVFATDQSRAFDRYGWAYYTREWADGWYPGYSDAWGSFLGAVGILYEQSSTMGLTLRRASGKRVSYRESVHGHAVSSLANLNTLVRNREAILRDYLAYAQLQLQGQPGSKPRSFALDPRQAPDRARRLLATLLRQGIQVYRAEAEFVGQGTRTALGKQAGQKKFAAGTLLVPDRQPRGALVQALLGFDPRLKREFLLEEREALEKKNRSELYDTTAWNLGHAFGLDAAWVDSPRVQQSQLTGLPKLHVGIEAAKAKSAPWGWLVDGRQDASLTFAVRALELGLNVHVADEPFSAAGRSFPRGSVLVRRIENPSNVQGLVDKAASQAKVRAVATQTGLSTTSGPDLGGQHFKRLSRPRVAVLANSPVSPSDYGHVWHHLDQNMQLPITLLDAQQLGGYDLRRYNVIVLPPAYRSLKSLLTRHKKSLQAWVRSGGTLIALGRSAEAVASKEVGLTKVKLRRDVLPELALYAAASKRQLGSRALKLDEKLLWDGSEAGSTKDKPAKDKPAAKDAKVEASKPEGKGKKDKPSAAALADEWKRRFAPRGVYLRGLLSNVSWLTLGASDELPVFHKGSHALVAHEPVRVPVRFAPAARLRLSGLLWPEARERLAETVYLARESVGSGQVILFASSPVFRGGHPGTARLLSNAVVYGASLGARQPIGW